MGPSSTHDELRRRLLDEIKQLLPAGKPAVLLGAPTSHNSGDVAIALGELTSLRALDVPLKYVSPVVRFDRDMIDREPDATILLQGGGNLGTFWPENQAFRERVLSEFPHRTIVQLPQSVWFDDTSSLEKARRAFAEHPDFTVLVRDQASYDFMQTQFDCRARLAPDAAFGLPSRRTPSSGGQIRWLRREDHERRDLEYGPEQADVSAFDWPGLDGTEERYRRFFLGLTGRVDGHRPAAAMASPILMKIYHAFAERRVGRAYDEFSEVGVLITERLHGLILAYQAGVPVVALDNLSNKLSGFVSTWLSDSPDVYVAHDGREAMSIANQRSVDAST